MARADAHARGIAASAASRLLSALFAVILAAGLGLIAYPTASDWWNRLHQSHAVAVYERRVSQLTSKRRAAMLDQARAYNERLASQADRWHPTAEETEEYESLLDVTGTGIMGYVTIPRLHVRIPIQHGTDESVLQIALGHLQGSSLPVGGASTHTVVAGHTGLPSARLLTGLDRMRRGDTFAIHVLGETLTYEVDRISVVLPEFLNELTIEDGADQATLVTCTPYGVNSHRLLVRGRRIATPSRTDGREDDVTQRLTASIGAAGAVAATGAILLIVRKRRATRPRGRHLVPSGTPAGPDDDPSRRRSDHERRPGLPTRHRNESTKERT